MYMRGAKSVGSLRKRGVIWTQEAPKAPWKELKFEKRARGDGEDGDGDDGDGSSPGPGNSGGTGPNSGPGKGPAKAKSNAPTAAVPPPQLTTPPAPSSTSTTSQASTSTSSSSSSTTTTSSSSSTESTTSSSSSSSSVSTTSFSTSTSSTTSSTETPSTLSTSSFILVSQTSSTRSESSSSFSSVSQQGPESSSSALTASSTTSFSSVAQQSPQTSSSSLATSSAINTQISSTQERSSSTVPTLLSEQTTLLSSTYPTSTLSGSGISTSPQYSQGNTENGLGAATPSNNGKVVTAVSIVTGIGGMALILTAVIFFLRRHYRKRREATLSVDGDSESPSGPYGLLSDEPQPFPARPRMGLHSWHDSILGSIRDNSVTDTANTLNTSDVLATPSRWQIRPQSTVSDVSSVRSDPFNLESPDTGRVAIPPGRLQTFYSLDGSAPDFQAPAPVILPERAGYSDYPANEATPWTKGETTKGKSQVRKAAAAKEMALQRELERQGFVGSLRDLPPSLADRMAELAAKRTSEAVTEPARWRTAVSWVRDQGERFGNRISVSTAPKTGEK